MELKLSSEEAAFRDEVRAFIAENYPAEMRVPNPGSDIIHSTRLSRRVRLAGFRRGMRLVK